MSLPHITSIILFRIVASGSPAVLKTRIGANRERMVKDVGMLTDEIDAVRITENGTAVVIQHSLDQD